MPRRGYKKGISDTKQPVEAWARARMTVEERIALRQDAKGRGLTVSKLLRALVTAHVKKTRLEVPRANGPSRQLIKEMARIGNNLNQLTRQANTGMVMVNAKELRPVLEAVTAALKKI